MIRLWDYLDTVPWCWPGYGLALVLLLLWNYAAHKNNHLCKPKLYPMYCVWPRCEGKETIAGWSPIEGSSGICPECAMREFGQEAE